MTIEGGENRKRGDLGRKMKILVWDLLMHKGQRETLQLDMC